MDISQSFQTLMNQIAGFLPTALVFVATIIIGWIVAKVLRKVVTKLLARVGLDRAAERGGLRRFTGKYTMSEMVGLLVYAAVWLFTLQLGFGWFGTNPVSTMINSVIAFLPQVFVALIIMVVAFAIANMVFDLVSSAMSSVSYGRPLARVAQVMIIAIAAVAALNQIGVATTVTMPVLITVLAMIAGVVVVGVGGGLIAPMRSRWERILNSAEAEAGNLKTQMSNRQSSPEFGQQAYTSQQYSQEGADTQQQQQYQQQTGGGQQYYTPPTEQPPQPPTGA
ncbi:mechanosensitive ion channel family protein [Stackebrandtia nassauensis]|uniref:Conserved TM helix repeat-containing protein n=1 Tax=Stackebrandtia nassauensis (strain DSM 44728 / CIP 108903 / NRRL B-16338 / NBRC 102104 / LLR-40K-21) TaxID=446470 RepID=D3Q010_STANL|nr:TM helix repeat-containing protein [Stackebrandtia nassauensis]ADD45539.1 Conserved TM helix repeat-containing protein [Stackebrandtia nassauensis DSM 44728]